MRAFKLSLLLNYFALIKNKKKALLVINIGIFISIFAISSALISFFIEKKINKLEVDIFDLQDQVQFFNNQITTMENNFNLQELDLIYEERSVENFKLINFFTPGLEIISSIDIYAPVIYSESISGIFESEFYSETLVDAIYQWNSNLFEDEEKINEFEDFLKKKQKARKIDFKKYEEIIYSSSYATMIEEIVKHKNYSILNFDEIYKDYKTIKDFRYATRRFEKKILSIIRRIKTTLVLTIDSYEKKIITNSNKEKILILFTFFLQLIVFIIIQFFEISSLNQNKKKLK